MQLEEIHNAKKAIEQMTYGLQFYKDEKRKDKQIKLINTFIKLVNAAEASFDRGQLKDVCDVVLLQSLKMWFEKVYDVTHCEGMAGWLRFNEQMMRLDLKLGYDAVLDDLSLKMAIAMVDSCDSIPESRKVKDLRTDNAMLLALGDVRDHYKNEIEKYLSNCYIALGSGVIKGK